MRPKINPKFQHHCGRCTCLGEVVINDVRADVFICDDIAIARFSDHPDDYEAQHLKQLTMHSNVFLLTAFRLYLEVQNDVPVSAGIKHEARALQS